MSLSTTPYMTRQEYIDYVKLEVTGGLLELEIDDTVLGKYVDNCLIELRRFYDQPKLVTVPFAKCIDLGPYTDSEGVVHEGFNSSAVVKIYRTEGYTGDNTTGATTSDIDPMYAQQWMAFSSGGTMYNLNNYVLNYLAYNTLLQMRNTSSTELSFKEDKEDQKLYINAAYDKPSRITIEYIPRILSCEDITSDYWIDILKRLIVAKVKIALGRIRTRFTASSTLWAQDGETILTEGTTEYNDLMTKLIANNSLFYPVD